MSSDITDLRWRRALCAVTVIIALGFFHLASKPVAFSVSVMMHYPYSLDREEAFVLNQAMLLARGETIYPSIDNYPYIVGNYTPVYPLMVRVFLFFLDGLMAGRLLTLQAGIVLAVLLGVYAGRVSRVWWSGLLPPGIFLATYDVAHWLPFVRVDFLAILFSVAGLLVLVFSLRTGAVVAAAVLFVLAFYTKQTQIMAPLAALIALLAAGERRSAMILAGTGASVGLLLGVALTLMTSGEFIRHTVTYNANEFHWRDVGIMLRHLSYFWSAMLVLVPAGLLLVAVRWRSTPFGVRLAAVYTVLTALSVLAIGKAGSAVNYLLDFEAAAGLFVGTLLGHAVSARLYDAAAAILALVGVQVVLLHSPFRRLAAFPPPMREEHRATADFLAMDMQDRPGHIISEDAIFTILAGKPVVYQPFIMSTLAREGRWDPTPFISALASGRFSVIIAASDLREPSVGFTDPMREAILARYELRQHYRLPGLSGPENRFVYTLKEEANGTPQTP